MAKSGSTAGQATTYDFTRSLIKFFDQRGSTIKRRRTALRLNAPSTTGFQALSNVSIAWSDFTNQRIRKHGEVDEAERSRNRHKSRIRARVEHVFAVVKRLWGFSKVRYRGLDKNANRSFVALGLANLYLSRTRVRA